MAQGLMTVFHHDLAWTKQFCLHKNRGSDLNLDNAAAFSVLVLKAENVGESTLSVCTTGFMAIRQ